MNTLRVLFLACGCEPQELTVAFNSDGDKLRTMQALVGGMIERLVVKPDKEDDYLAGGIDFWLNEQGKLIGLPPNFGIPMDGPFDDVVMGNVFFSRYDSEGETVSLTDEDCRFLHNAIGKMKRIR